MILPYREVYNVVHIDVFQGDIEIPLVRDFATISQPADFGSMINKTSEACPSDQ